MKIAIVPLSQAGTATSILHSPALPALERQLCILPPAPLFSSMVLYWTSGGHTVPHVVGPKGQVVIAKEIRDQLGVEPGWLAIQRLVDDHVEVYFLPPEHRRSLKGSLADQLKVQVAPGKEWRRAREAAWRKAAEDTAWVGERAS